MSDLLDKNMGESQEVKNPGRRQLLKFLAAGGVAAAASMVPGKWVSPVVKSGVLPAHAQVTPGRYEVRCNPEYGEEPSEVSRFFFLQATAWDTVANAPLAGVQLTATIQLSQGSAQDTATTNAQGLADFTVEVPNSELPVAGATVTFTSPGVYGTASCTIPFRAPS